MAGSSRFAIAVHALALLASAGKLPLKSDSIARSVNTNPVVIRRLLGALVQAGLITCQTGPAGGARLALKPQKISLLDIYRSTNDHAVFGLHCRKPDRSCFVGRNIEAVLCEVQDQVDEALAGVLAGISLHEIVTALSPEAVAGRRN